MEIHCCTGSPLNGPHVEVNSPPRRASYYQVSKIEQYMYDSSIRLWFESITSVKGAETPRDTCWRVKDGASLCSGKRRDSPRLIVSIPVVLILEAPEYSEPNPSSKSQSLPPWDFPATLTPSAIVKSEAERKGITYDLIGLGFFSESSMHFIARYADKETSQIYTYDSMRNKGDAVSEPNAEVATHIAGQVHANIPPTYTPSLAIYHLRGGMEAQQAFFESQTNACAKSYPLQFSTRDISPLSALPDVTYIGQDCPIELKPSGRHRKQEGMKEYVSKMQPISPEYNPPESSGLVPSKTVPPPIILGDGPESEEEIEPLRTPTATTKPLTTVTNTGDQESPPDSPFKIKCRCGFEGDGNVCYDENEGEAVLCTECECWSHVACQKNGRASKLRGEGTLLL